MASASSSAKVWDFHSKEKLVEFKHDEIASVGFTSNQSLIVATLIDNEVETWDAAKNTKIATMSGHKDLVISAAFNRDATRLITGSRDASARVWDTATGEEIAELHGWGDRVYSTRATPVMEGMELGNTVEWVSFSDDNIHAISVPRLVGTRVWDVRYATLSGKDLVAELCATKLPNMTTLTRDEMRLIGYPDNAPPIDACGEISDLTK
jgi:WD40 repeat protein